MSFERHVLPLLGFCLALTLGVIPAHAWKPKTHIYFTNAALDEILNDEDGNPEKLVRIWMLDAAGQPVGEPVYETKLEQWLELALGYYRGNYIAGVIGPDAYPDIATGQMNIHPKIARELNGSEAGTDAFLQHIWDSAENSDCFACRTRARVFARGYLTHAVGDMFAHTLVNHYTGGPFAFKPDGPWPPNGLRHYVMEGFIGERTEFPENSAPDIEGLEEWLYQTLVRADPGSSLERQLFLNLAETNLLDPGEAAGFAKVFWVIPRFYSQLRNGVQGHIDDYDRLPDGDPRKLVGSLTIDSLHTWVAAIDEGLREWIRLNKQISDVINFDPDDPDGGDFAEAEKLAQVYATKHLAAMSGMQLLAPGLTDAAGAFLEIHQALMGPYNEVVEKFRNGLLEQLFAPIGSYEEIKKYWTNPGTYFDATFRDTGAPVTKISRAQFSTDVLKIGESGFLDWRNVAAGYNTVLMTKLVLLNPDQINCLIRKVDAKLDGGACRCEEDEDGSEPLCAAEGSQQLEAPNVMLGFLESIDDSSQWERHAKPEDDDSVTVGGEKADLRTLVFAREEGELYDALFKDVLKRPDVCASSETLDGRKLFSRFDADFEPDPEGLASQLGSSQNMGNAYLLSLLSWIAYAPDRVARQCADAWGLSVVEPRVHSETPLFFDFANLSVETGSTQAYVFYNDEAAIVAIAGSTLSNYAQDWIDSDLDLRPRAMPADWGDDTKVHTGFFEAESVAHEEVARQIRELPATPHPEGRKLWITGHSLGGAIAFMLAHHLAHDGEADVHGVQTYGGPPVGNQAWRDHFQSEVSNVQRWSLENDPAPVIFPRPPFAHVGIDNKLMLDASQKDLATSEPFEYSISLATVNHLAVNHMCYWERLAREVGATASAPDGSPPAYPLPPLSLENDWMMRPEPPPDEEPPDDELPASPCDKIFEEQR